MFKLRRGHTVYYHHVEFQARPTRKMNRRCFLYDALLLDQYQAPVITTIVYLFPQRKPIEPVFRVELDGREINRWQFGCVHLWDIEAPAALEPELPGVAALVPLMKGVAWEHIEQAVRQIETKAPAKHQNDLLAILHTFAEAKYTTERMDQLIGRKRLMEYQFIAKDGLKAGWRKREPCAGRPCANGVHAREQKCGRPLAVARISPRWKKWR